MTITNSKIRIECSKCNEAEDCTMTLAELKAAGWTEIHRQRTYRQSCKTYENSDDEPPGYSLLDWQTHHGLCPDHSRAAAIAEKN